MSESPKTNDRPRSARYDHSFASRRLTVYSKPVVALIQRHFERLDSSFLRLSNDFIWMSDDKQIKAMMGERASILTAFESEIDGILETYGSQLTKYALTLPDMSQLKPSATFEWQLHASASIDAVRLFAKLDQIFLHLECMKQNGLIDDLAFIHTCNAWKNSTGQFVKSVHALRTRWLDASKKPASPSTEP